MAKRGKPARRVLFAPRMEGETISPAKRREQWGEAFDRVALAELNEAAKRGTDPRARHSDGKVP